MIINFNNLKGIFNKHIDMLLASTGLTTRCQLNFGISKKNLCPNCIYDPNLKKSANKYKSGGPVEFGTGKICPVCNGIGSYGEILSEDIYLAVLWNYKDWINPPPNIINPEGFVQTICNKDSLSKIRQCKDMTIVVNENLANPVFILEGEPNFAGLGDNNYLFCIWKKTGSQNIVKPPIPTPTRSPTPTNNITRTPTPSNSATPSITPTSTLFLTRTPTNSITPSNTPTNTVTPTSTPSSSATPSISISPSVTSSINLTLTPTPTLTSTPTFTPSNTLVLFNSIGINSANYGNCADWSSLDGNVTDVGTNGGPSAYGTYDQSGNVWEWNEAIISPYRGLRGGAYNGTSSYLSSSFRNNNTPNTSAATYGFRIVSLSGNPYNFSKFVAIGDFINPNDTSPVGYGSVGYSYHIQQYEVTNTEYVNFLNSIASTDTYGCYDTNMGSNVRGGIIRSGSSGAYTYMTKSNMQNKPVNFVSWFNAARFCNWLHNNMPSGLQNNNTTESGAYYLNGTTSDNTIIRSTDAIYSLPTEDEWYKAAYYKGGSNNSGYWNYATQYDSVPICSSASNSGVGILPTPSPTTSRTTPTPTRTPTQTPTVTPTPSRAPWPTVFLLLHFDGNDGDTTFLDSSLSNLTVNNPYSPTEASISTQQSVFGGSSARLNFIADQFSQAPGSIAVTGNFPVLSGDFTIETWAWFDNVSAYNVILRGNPGLDLRVSGSSIRLTQNLFEGTYSLFPFGLYGNPSLSNNTWHHIAMSRKNGLLRCFVNGILMKDYYGLNGVINTDSYTLGNQLSIGQMFGYLDEFRITLSGVYESNFVVPTQPFNP